MYIKNVTLDDDSQYGILGRYECHAFAVNDTTPRKHGFSVNVITRKYSLPWLMSWFYYRYNSLATYLGCAENYSVFPFLKTFCLLIPILVGEQKVEIWSPIPTQLTYICHSPRSRSWLQAKTDGIDLGKRIMALRVYATS